MFMSRLLLLILLLFPLGSVADTVYRTTDAQGNVVFTDTPPANATPAEHPADLGSALAGEPGAVLPDGGGGRVRERIPVRPRSEDRGLPRGHRLWRQDRGRGRGRRDDAAPAARAHDRGLRALDPGILQVLRPQRPDAETRETLSK